MRSFMILLIRSNAGEASTGSTHFLYFGTGAAGGHETRGRGRQREIFEKDVRGGR